MAALFNPNPYDQYRDRITVRAGLVPKPAPAQKSSYAPVVDTESFSTVRNRMGEAKGGIMKRQVDLLAERSDLSNRPAKGAVMDRTKPLQEGVRVEIAVGSDLGPTRRHDAGPDS